MKLIEKLARDLSLQIARLNNPEVPDVQLAYIAGFRKAREMARLELIKNANTCSVGELYVLLDKLGEEEV